MNVKEDRIFSIISFANNRLNNFFGRKMINLLNMIVGN